MRTTFFVLAFSAVFAAAATMEPRGLTDFPKCAITCLVKSDHGKCHTGEFKCLCHNQNYITKSTQCIESKCEGKDIAKAKAAQAKTCKGL